MIVRCPQCQYTNKTEVEAAKPRIVCARCATVISVEFLSNYNLASMTDADSTSDTYEKQYMHTPETSPLDLDTLLETPQSTSVASPVIVTPLAATPTGVESRFDGDEILDIPRVTQPVQEAVMPQPEAPLVVEELLPTEPIVEATVLEDVTTDSAPIQPVLVDSSLPNTQQFPPVESPLYDVQNANYVDASQVNSQYLPDVEAPRAAAAGAGQSAVFGQDSYNRNTFVVATPDKGNKTRLIRILLSVGLLCAVLAVGWWALSGLVKDWMGMRKSGDVAETLPRTQPPANANANANKPNNAPTTIPSLGQKVGTDKNANAAPSAVASASAVASPSAAASAKASAKPAEAKATPTAAPSQPQKPAPAPPQTTGNAGHSVGASDGSLTVQFASYKSAGEAQSTVSRLKSAGIDARVVKAEVPGKGTWYRVQGGRFTNESEAGKFGAEARAKGAAKDFVITGYQAQ